MRILYVTQWFDPEPAFKGAAFARALADAGHEVRVVTGFPNYPGGKLYSGYRIRPFRRDVIDGITVDRLPLWPSHDQSSLGRVANYLSFFLSLLVYCLWNLRRYDIAYVYHPPITPALATALAGAVHRVPFVPEIQDLWPDSVAVSGMANPRMVAMLDRACRFVYRRAAHIVCQSQGMRDRIVARGVPRERTSCIYNWSNYHPAAGEAAALPEPVRRAFEDRINFVYGGNIGGAQALEHLVAATRLAAARVPGLRLHLFGKGIRLTEIAALAAASDGAVLVHPAVPRAEMDRIFEAADVLALHLADDPLFEVTIPSKLQHYLSVGRPVVAGIGGEAARLLTESGAALVAPPADVPALAEAMVALGQRSPAERTAMGAQGADYYRRHMGFDHAVAETLALLERHARTPDGARTVGMPA